MDRRSSRIRAGAVLVGAALVAVALSAGGVDSAPKPLTKKKALKLFYTQAESDALFSRQGKIVLSHNGPWVFNEAYNATIVHDDVASVELESSTPGNAGAVHHLLAPVNLGMRTYGLERLRFCYALQSMGGSADKIEATEVWEQHADLAIEVINNTSDRTAIYPSGECYEITPSSPYTPTDAGSLVLNVVHTSDTAGDRLHIYGVRTTWVSTGPAPA
jgi:hypothetical protein